MLRKVRGGRLEDIGDPMDLQRHAGHRVRLRPQDRVIQRKVSSRGGIQVACQRIHVSLPHAGRIEVPSREEALRWAAKVAVACRCAQEVRAIGPDPELDEMLRQADR